MGKRAIIILALTITALAASAQDRKAETLKEVRALYSKALDDIKQRDSECPECIDKIAIINEQMLPGTGEHKKATTIYFHLDAEEDGSGSATPYFIRVSYNLAARTYLEEYLFEDGRLVFSLIKENDYPATETRVYIKNGIAILDRKETAETQAHPFNMQKVDMSNEHVQSAIRKANALSETLNILASSY